jgi:DHA1 family tetracycline resistance protein-like MFS transporter
MPGINILFLTNFLFFGGFSFFTTFFAVYLVNKFHLSQGNIGDFFAYVGICSALTQAFITRAVSKRFSESRVIRITLIGTGLMILAYFLPRYSWQILFIPPIFGIFTGLSMANLTSLLSRSTPPQMQGEILGINASVQALASFIPAVLSGFIAASLSPEAPLVIASVVVIIGAISFNLLYKVQE